MCNMQSCFTCCGGGADFMATEYEGGRVWGIGRKFCAYGVDSKNIITQIERFKLCPIQKKVHIYRIEFYKIAKVRSKQTIFTNKKHICTP